MGMGCKVELNNIVSVAAGQRYVSAKNEHSWVSIYNESCTWGIGSLVSGLSWSLKWMDSRAILLWISLCLCGGWPRKLWEQLAAFTSRVKGYINVSLYRWLFP